MSTLTLPPSDPLRPPAPPGLGRGFAFALIAHAALLAALSAGVSWRNQETPAFEAELWSAAPQAAAPKEQAPPTPEPETEPSPPPKPVVAPPPPPPVDNHAERDAEIAIAKAKDKKKKEAQELQRQAELEAQRKKDKEREAAERERLEKLQKLEKRQKQEMQEKLDKQAAEAKQKSRQDADAKKKSDAARDAKAEAQRQDNLRRIQGMAGATGAPDARGTALQASGPSANYAGRIKARIRPNIIYPDTSSANPVAEVEVRTAPDGAILSRKLLKPSGDGDWDAAVLRAIDKTEILPRDTDGRVPSVLVISFKPRE
ncbi:cell envelope integrity protein TolA [Roseateles koreensis]|uniref:Cell envelope integrity protein TolA n=1 Tax=Roseateles koreensis TaxID=2987526 RepID=A0ABT5KNH3_9BURK|nr:cell envelope integrity protein TolA [Roseateles koreensis]MDC8784466.1 cell envelope integrity protein TolA [Roseateles koreensis]